MPSEYYVVVAETYERAYFSVSELIDRKVIPSDARIKPTGAIDLHRALRVMTDVHLVLCDDFAKYLPLPEQDRLVWMLMNYEKMYGRDRVIRVDTNSKSKSQNQILSELLGVNVHEKGELPPPEEEEVCWICHESIFELKWSRDEHGFAHQDCLNALNREPLFTRPRTVKRTED